VVAGAQLGTWILGARHGGGAECTLEVGVVPNVRAPWCASTTAPRC
jgi:hypothetical protein